MGLEGIWASATGNRETYASKTLCGQFWSYKEDEDESVARQRRRFFFTRRYGSLYGDRADGWGG